VSIVKGSSYESTGFGEKSLPLLQDHPPQRRGTRDLQGTAPQATAGLTRASFVFTDED
jgi:hypothetical protein